MIEARPFHPGCLSIYWFLPIRVCLGLYQILSVCVSVSVAATCCNPLPDFSASGPTKLYSWLQWALYHCTAAPHEGHPKHYGCGSGPDKIQSFLSMDASSYLMHWATGRTCIILHLYFDVNHSQSLLTRWNIYSRLWYIIYLLLQLSSDSFCHLVCPSDYVWHKVALQPRIESLKWKCHRLFAHQRQSLHTFPCLGIKMD